MQLTLEDGSAVLWGGELILRNGVPVGNPLQPHGRHTGVVLLNLGLVSDETGINKDWLEQGDFEIDVAEKRYRAKLHQRSPYDPRSRTGKTLIVFINFCRILRKRYPARKFKSDEFKMHHKMFK